MSRLLFKVLLLWLSCYPVLGQKNILKRLFKGSLIQDDFNVFREITQFKEFYDFIIVGCGSSGSVLANRLTENKKHEVLCLEAGFEESLLTDVPLLAPYLSFTEYNWDSKAERQVGVCEGMENMRCLWPRGRAVGGSSVINYMMYTRGNPKDYDKWANMGNDGWSYNDISPYFKKFENVKIRDIRNSSIRGTSGELDIIYSPCRTEIAYLHLKSASELGIPIRDINGKNQIGISIVQANLKNGRRMSAAKAFLHPIKNRPNLHIAKNAFVTKVIIDPINKVASGVEFVIRNNSYSVKAVKEVILSAGPLSSPQILMLSGVGPKNELKRVGINVIQDLPVGERLQDHVVFGGLQFIIDQPVSLNDLRLALNPLNLLNYVNYGRGPYTITGGTELYAFLNTRESKFDYPGLEEDVPDIELVFTGGGISGDFGQGLRKSLGISDEIYNDLYRPIRGKDSFSIVTALLKPQSIGRMMLKSKNPFEQPLFYPNYYSNENDLRHMLRGIRWAIKFGQSKAIKKLNPRLYDKKFKQCSHHKFNSDEYWMCSARLLSNNLHHQVGTCKMGPDGDPTAVVDSQLRVRGISRLRVVDVSIIPEIPAGHTMAAAFMIAEKAADIIKASWNEQT